MAGRRSRRKREHWWTTPLGFAIGIAMASAALPVSIYVTEHLSAWAAPIVWAALAICALACVAYFASKVNGWLVCGILGFTVSLAMVVSLSEGWESQFQIAINAFEVLYLLGCVAFFIAVIVFSVRLHRRVYAPMREGLRAIGEGIHTDALFRDDGERIVTHPRWWPLLRLIIGQAVFVAACALGLWWAAANAANPLVMAAIGFLLALCALLLTLNLARLVMRGPTLIVGPDGILDGGSQIVTGRGLIRWDEIVTVFEYTYKSRKFSPTQRMLMFVLTDLKAVRDRQPFIKRMLGFLGRGQLPGAIVLVRALLDQPPDALAERIKAYAKSHAPRGWDSPLIADDEEAESGGSEESGAPSL